MAQADIIGSEVEALRIDILRGGIEGALPQVEERLTKLQTWWDLSRSGARVPEAPDLETLARSFIGTLNIISHAYIELKNGSLLSVASMIS